MGNLISEKYRNGNPQRIHARMSLTTEKNEFCNSKQWLRSGTHNKSTQANAINFEIYYFQSHKTKATESLTSVILVLFTYFYSIYKKIKNSELPYFLY